MEKDTRLINIYLKIHNKRALTMDDLCYLAEYDPECFEKACKNVVYNIPETKSIMEAAPSEAFKQEKEEPSTEPCDRKNIEKILENLKRLEINEFPVADIDTDKVKSLLGDLYMELLFPHDDKYAYIDMEDSGDPSLFDKKA